MGLSSFIFEKLAKLQGGEVSRRYEYASNCQGYGNPLCNWGRDFGYAEPTVRQLSLIPTKNGQAKVYALTETLFMGLLPYERTQQRVELGELSLREARKMLRRFDKVNTNGQDYQCYHDGLKLYEVNFKGLPEGTYMPVGKPDILHWRGFLAQRLGALECVAPEQRLPLVWDALTDKACLYAKEVAYKRGVRLYEREIGKEKRGKAYQAMQDKMLKLSACVSQLPVPSFTPPQ